MKAVLTCLCLFFFAGVFSQDSTRIKFDELNKLYKEGRITFDQLQTQSQKLLHPDKDSENSSFLLAHFDTSFVPRTEEYCLLIGNGKLFSTKVTIEIDFGQKRNFFGDNRLKDSSGKLVEFESLVDALNFMNSKGWELYAAYPMVSNMGTAYHYLMKRKVLSK